MPRKQPSSSLKILVEGSIDATIVGNILMAAGITQGFSILICEGKQSIAKAVSKLKNTDQEKFIALIDADEPSVADSRELAAKQLNHPSIPVFCAVPTIEAWLFADDLAASAAAKNDVAAKIIERTSLPESIPYPKYLASNIFPRSKSKDSYDFLKYINIQRATARSPSLRAFIVGIVNALGNDIDIANTSLSSSVNRDVFSTILRELPADTIAWKTLNGDELTAQNLAKNVAEGTEIGKQYVTEVLRIARDIVARKARK